MKEIITEYLRGVKYLRHTMTSIELWGRIPSDTANFTGKYKTINSEFFIEIEERKNSKSFFFFDKTEVETRFVSEHCFRFFDIEHFKCGDRP
jgi:hypothetical protein